MQARGSRGMCNSLELLSGVGTPISGGRASPVIAVGQSPPRVEVSEATVDLGYFFFSPWPSGILSEPPETWPDRKDWHD